MQSIRNAAKAIIIEEGKILLTKNKSQRGTYYLLPGGGQKPAETIEEALRRECREEVAAEIKVGDIVFVRDYIGANHEFKIKEADVHQIEYMFACQLKEKEEMGIGSEPDDMQVGIEWIDLKELANYNLYPKVLTELINQDGSFNDDIYLGDVN